MIVTHVHRLDIPNVVAGFTACYLIVNLAKLAFVVWLNGGKPTVKP